MNTRNERAAFSREDWIEWSNVTPLTDMDPETEREWREAVQDGASIFSTPDNIGITDLNEPGPWFMAGFESPCEYGDDILEGDTIRADGFGGYEHQECVNRGASTPPSCKRCFLVHAPGQEGCE